MRCLFAACVRGVFPTFKGGNIGNCVRSASGVGGIPPIAPSGTKRSVHVDTNTESYRNMAKELALLSTEEFSHRLHRFSRTNFDPSQATAVHAHVSELLSRRLSEVSYKSVREYGQLAHVAGLHDLCLAVYYARARLTSGPSVSDADGVAGSFVVSDSVVDSAYHIGSTNDLVRLGAHCVKHLQHVPSLGWEVMSSFSLARTFWRCVCIVSYLDRVQSADVKQALQDAEYIFREHITAIYPEAAKELSVRDAIHTVKRFVQYASCGDEGEMLFFRFCLRRGLLRKGSNTALLRQRNESGFSSVGGSVMDAEVSYGGDTNGTTPADQGLVSEEQWFYAALVATCRAGHHVHEALCYFDEVGTRFGVERMGCNMQLGNCPHGLSTVAGSGEQAARTASGCDAQKEGISDYLFFQLLTVLHAAKNNGMIVFTARAMLRRVGELSISVWSIVLIAAGEMRAFDVAVAAFLQAKNALSDSSRWEGRRGNEYLLQTSILALSKCQVARFEEDYLRPGKEQLLTHSTDEFFHCALLQHAHNSTDPGNAAEEIFRSVKQKGTPLSPSLVSRLMKIFSRVESPKLVELYQYATQQCGVFRASWLYELLLWADRRRYNLTTGERKYILDEVHRVYGGSTMKSELSGLRSQLALLRYDYEQKPREVFLATLQPPPVEPAVLDPRAQFLVKRPHCVRQRRTKPYCDAERERFGSHDPAMRKYQEATEHSIAYNQNINGTKGDLRPEEFRLYMKKILEVLQHTNNGDT